MVLTLIAIAVIALSIGFAVGLAALLQWWD